MSLNDIRRNLWFSGVELELKNLIVFPRPDHNGFRDGQVRMTYSTKHSRKARFQIVRICYQPRYDHEVVS